MMKKSAVGGLALFLLAVGCSGLETTNTQAESVIKRHVINNTLDSKQPRLKIQVHEDFVYQGENREEETEITQEGGLNVTTYKDYYLFTHDGDGQGPRSIAVIFYELKGPDLRKIYWYFKPIDLSNMEHVIEEGDVKINGYRYSYCVFPDETTASGYCVLRRLIARTAGVDRNYIIQIIYTETVRYDSEFARLSDWLQPSGLSEAQQNRLREFNQNFHKYIVFPKK